MLSLAKTVGRDDPDFLAAQAKLDFTYSAVGATARRRPPATSWTTPASSWVKARRSSRGQSRPAGAGSSSAWAGWRRGRRRRRSRTGEVVAVMARPIGLWWLNACRIVYVVDEAGPVARSASPTARCRTMRGAGEERFLVEWDRDDGGVVRHPGLLSPELAAGEDRLLVYAGGCRNGSDGNLSRR